MAGTLKEEIRTQVVVEVKVCSYSFLRTGECVGWGGSGDGVGVSQPGPLIPRLEEGKQQ